MASRRSRRAWALVVLAGALSGGVGWSPAWAAPDLPEVPVPPQGDILDVKAKPVLTWSTPKRYRAGWLAYREGVGGGTYSPSYPTPAGWSVDLDGCSSTSTYRITHYTFEIVRSGTLPPGTPRSSKITTGSCKASFDRLPREGAYQTSLTLRTSLGVSEVLRQTIVLRDHLIVSIGDSYAAGEGNPDRAGEHRFTYDAGTWYPTGIATVRPEVWRDRRCHRSALSGPARAAQAIEDADPHSSVTFLSFACSGARIGHLVDQRYAGIEPVPGQTVEPQVEAVRRALGLGTARGTRTIDALMVSAGGNDMDFADIVEDCAANVDVPLYPDKNCVKDRGIEANLDSLDGRFDRLARAIRTRLPGTSGVHLAEYPADLFRGGGCGQLRGISSGEAADMRWLGLRINGRLVRAADEHAGDRWRRVPSVTKEFEPHAYCAAQRWFVSYEASLGMQGDILGTAHPNAGGHAAYARVLRQSVQLG